MQAKPKKAKGKGIGILLGALGLLVLIALVLLFTVFRPIITRGIRKAGGPEPTPISFGKQGGSVFPVDPTPTMAGTPDPEGWPTSTPDPLGWATNTPDPWGGTDEPISRDVITLSNIELLYTSSVGGIGNLTGFDISLMK